MPKFYVRLEPNGPPDEEGENLPNRDAAERLADAIAFDLALGPLTGPYQRVVITDENGEVVCERPLVTH